MRQNNALTILGNNNWGQNGLQTLQNYDRSTGDITIESDITSTNCSGSSLAGLGYGNINLNAISGDSYVTAIHNGLVKLFYFHNGGLVNIIATTFRCTNNVPFHIKLVVLQVGGARLYANNSLAADATLSVGTFTNQKVYLQTNSNGGTITYDNFTLADTTSTLTVPADPSGLTATPGSGQVTLNWTAQSNGGSVITDYIVEYKLASASSWIPFDDGTSISTTAVVTGLANGSMYQFRVSAVNSEGPGSPSNIVYRTVGILGLNDIFAGTNIDGTKWAEIDSASGGSGGTVGNVQQNDSLTIVGNNSWGSNGLESVSTFDRTTGNINIESDISSSNCSTHPQVGLVYGNKDLAANPGDSYIVASHGTGVIKLFYFHNGGLVSIISTSFHCTNEIPFHLKLVVLQTGGAEVYINNSATPDAATNQGTFTNQKFFLETNVSGATITYNNLYLTETNIPDAPSGLTATPGDGQVTLNWTAPNNNGSTITDYIVEYKLTSDSSWITFPDDVSVLTSASVTGLINGSLYSFRVSAVSVNGIGSVSAITTSIPVTVTPSAPQAVSVRVSNIPAVNEIVSGLYTFLDPNGDTEGLTTFRWLRADTSGGIYSAIQGATSSTYTVTSDDLNKYLKFEVTPVSLVAPQIGEPVLSLASNVLPTVNHILVTGQSLSVGWNGSPALTTTQLYNNLMLSGSSLIPLIESSVETINSAMANSIASLVPNNDYQVEVTNNGVPGAEYASLKKGTTPYNNGIDQINTSKTATEALNKNYRVTGIVTIHGETDHVSGNDASYEGYLTEWQNDYQTDIEAITGQTGIIPMFTDQTSSHTGYGYATSEMPIAQLSASEDNPEKIILVGPKYFLNYSDTAHLTNTSYRWLGEYYGKIIKKVTLDKQSWKPLSPQQIIRNRNVIYAKFNVPSGPIVFDTTLVDLKTNYGFEYADDSSSASISNVEIINSDTVKITLNTIPTGTNQKLRYAYTGTAGSNPGAHVAGSARGNLRDSDNTTSLYGDSFYNWAVQFNKTMTVDSTPPIISEVTSVTTPTTNSSPSYTFTTNEAGNISYAGGCSSLTLIATSGSNTITFNTLSGTYDSCTITVTDTVGNISNILPITPFTVNPIITSIGLGYTSTGIGYNSNTGQTINIPSSGIQTVVVVPSVPQHIVCVPYLTLNLKFKQIHSDVKKLQQFLNSHGILIAQKGAGSPGNETTKFGLLTRTAVIKFQEKYRSEILIPVGLVSGSGFVGAMTLKKINTLSCK